MKIGAQVRVFNFAMRNRRAELGWTQADLHRVSGVSIEAIGRIERLELPAESIRGAKDRLARIAAALELEFDYLFPGDYLDSIQRKLLPRRRSPVVWVKEIPIETLPPSLEVLSLPEPEAEDFDLLALKNALEEQFHALTTREVEVLTKRFGLDGEGEKTRAEIGRGMSVSGIRVRQIEESALRKLRHPIHSFPLRQFLLSDQASDRQYGFEHSLWKDKIVDEST